jgi:hypothetical protein
MGGIPARRRSAHTEDGIAGEDPTDDQFNFGLVMNEIWKGDDIADSLSDSRLNTINKKKRKRYSEHNE